MSGTTVTVTPDKEDLRAIVQEKMYQMLDEKTREQLIRQALDALTKSDRYSSQTPIEQAFARAATTYANEVCQQYFAEHPEIQGVIRAICDQAMARLAAEDDTFRAAVADAVAQRIRVVTISRDDD